MLIIIEMRARCCRDIERCRYGRAMRARYAARRAMRASDVTR